MIFSPRFWRLDTPARIAVVDIDHAVRPARISVSNRRSLAARCLQARMIVEMIRAQIGEAPAATRTPSDRAGRAVRGGFQRQDEVHALAAKRSSVRCSSTGSGVVSERRFRQRRDQQMVPSRRLARQAGSDLPREGGNRVLPWCRDRGDGAGLARENFAAASARARAVCPLARRRYRGQSPRGAASAARQPRRRTQLVLAKARRRPWRGMAKTENRFCLAAVGGNAGNVDGRKLAFGGIELA